MLRKFLFNSLLIILFTGGVIFAQTSPVRGRIELQKADGTKTPFAGATIDAYRTDIKGKFPSAKSDKKGLFNFAGLPLGAVFVLAVSGEGINPEIYPNVKAGVENIVIVVREGKGTKLTEDEVRKMLSSAPKTADGQPAELTAEQKKEQEEFNRKVEEVKAKNQKIDESNKVVRASLEAGNNAFNAQKLDLAISEYTKGLEADPTHPGAPVLLTNRSAALRARGVITFNAAIQNKDDAAKAEGMTAAKKDFVDSAESAAQALQLLKAETPPTEQSALANFNQNKYNAISGLAESLRLVTTRVDQTRVNEMVTAYQEYFAVEIDPLKKAKAHLGFATALLDAQDFEKAIAEFEKILVDSPDNVDALAGAGLCLVNVGYISNDKAKLQQGANYLQKFIEIAPDTHRYKADAKGLIESLKKEQNVTPQKQPKGSTTKKKP